MKYISSRLISGALIASCATGALDITRPASATQLSTFRLGLPASKKSIHGRSYIRHIKRLGQTLTITGPSGCSGTYNPSFDGLPTLSNSPAGPYSGVIVGDYNEACDEYSLVAGTHNIIGGDGDSFVSTILGGFANEIQDAEWSFIGGGQYNSLDTESGQRATGSAIVNGTGNLVTTPSSLIGAGDNNSIVLGSSLYADDSFIGTGLGNTVESNSSAIVSGIQNTITVTCCGPDGDAQDGTSIIGAGKYNSIVGQYSGIVSGQTNSVTADNSSIVAGANNVNLFAYSSIVGGESNTLGGAPQPTSRFGVIAGGFGNTIRASAAGSAAYTFIGAGNGNVVSGSYSSILGGLGNLASGAYSEVGGGAGNTGSGLYIALGGGEGNVASGPVSTISGGYQNTASGRNASVPGGAYNIAGGTASFAAGYRAKAANDGTFVWNDDSGSTLVSTGSNEFMARASGGVFLYSSTDLSTGVRLAPGSGSWSTLSDRHVKTKIRNVDDAQILAKVARMPVSEWSYSAQGSRVRHLGPMAQDFRAAFGLGEDDRHISTVDEEGVALAAIKALEAQLKEKGREVSDLQRTNDEMRRSSVARDASIAALEARFDALEAAQKLR